MKKILLSISFIFAGVAAFCQMYPDNGQTAPNSNQQSPNLAKVSYLTNNTGKLIQAYPNPAMDQVIIQHVATVDRAVISVVSPEGRILQQRTVMPNTLQTELRVGMLSKGIYILRFDNAKGDVRTMQLVKN